MKAFAWGILGLTVGTVVIGGWVANIVKLIHTDFDPLTGMAVARVIGVPFAPLGVVLGFF